MSRLNKYYYGSRISEAKFRQIIHLYSQDSPAVKIAEITGISRVTINKILQKVRIRLVHLYEQLSPFSEDIETYRDNCKLIRPKSQQNTQEHIFENKMIIFAILKSNGNIYTEVIPDTSKKQLLQLMRGKINIARVIKAMD